MFSNTNEKLLAKFGPSGPLAWFALLAAAKRAPIQGVVSCLGERDFWNQLGLENDDHHPPFEEFLKLLGQLKQTSRTCSGRRLNVRISNFERWQKIPKRFSEAEKKRSKRAQNTADDTAPIDSHSAADRATERRGKETTSRESSTTHREEAPNNADGGAPSGGFAAASAWVENEGWCYTPGGCAEHLLEHWPELDDLTVQRLVKQADEIQRTRESEAS